MARKQFFFDLFIIIILGLTPLLWFPNGTVILGHDSGLPIDPIVHFVDRLFVWTQRFGIGTDQSSALLGAFLIHGIEALLSWLGFSLQAQQKIQFVFWFALPGLSMYFFAHKLWPEKRYLPVIASVIYMVNFYLLQGWFVAERTKFSIYAALPIVLYYAIAYVSRKESFKKSVIISGIVLSVFNGGGSVPLYGGLILMLGTFFLYYNYVFLSRESINRTFLYCISLGFICLLLNAYWLIPYVYYIFGFFSRDLALAGGTEGVIGWASYLSSGASFINLFRGQGIPDWYLNKYHAYASDFFNNPLLILVSFALPVIAYCSVVLAKEKKDRIFIYFFAIVGLVGFVFSSGPQSQLGIIYETMVRYVPGFTIFRSAFYKFAYVQWFSYAILIGFTLNWFLSRFGDKIKNRLLSSTIPYLLLIGLVLGWTLYHYPILDGSFFDYSKEPQKELTMRVKIPKYLSEFSEWINKQDPNTRFLIVPELNETAFVSYDWGYWSIAPLNSLLSRNSFVHNTRLIPENERFLMNQMYKSLLRQDIKSFTDFAEVFAIDGIILHKDVSWKNISWGTTNPAIYEQILENNPNFQHVKTFGEWKVYDFLGKEGSLRISATSKLIFLQGELANIVSFPYFDPKAPLFVADLDRENSPYYMSQASDIYIAPECINCELTGIGFGFTYYNPKILPGSLLYFLVEHRENNLKRKANDFSSLVNFYLTTSDRRIVEAKWMLDSKEKIENFGGTIKRHEATITDLHNLLAKKDWGITGKEENVIVRTVISHLLSQMDLIESIHDSFIKLSTEDRITLVQSYEKILEINDLMKNRWWITEDAVNKRYIYDFLKKGEYEIYVKRGSLAHPERDIDDVLVTSHDGSITLKPRNEIGGWLYFGTYDFRGQNLKLSLKDSTVKDLLDGVHPTLPTNAKGIVTQNNYHAFTTKSRNECFYYQVDNLGTTGERYLVSFRYKNTEPKSDISFYPRSIKESAPNNIIERLYLPRVSEWTDYTYPVIVKDGGVKIYFCSSTPTLKETYDKSQDQTRSDEIAVEIQDIKLEKVSFPNVILYKRQRETNNDNYVINFEKSNPVQYKVRLSSHDGPVTLTLKESYGRFWEACDKNGKCSSDNARVHFATAGFANSWYFEDGVNEEISLYYLPQRMFVIGGFISLVSASIISIGIVLNYVGRKKNN